MSFPSAHFTRFSKSPQAYKQYAPDDPVEKSIYDVNMECDASLRFQNRAILIVDSKDRSNREEPNKYTVKLNKSYRDVVSIELKNADIPNSDYIINENNNMFYFQDTQELIDTDQYYQIQIPVGHYPADDPTLDSIRSLLEQALNLAGPNTYTVTVDPNKMQFTITQTSGSGIFRILFVFPKETEACQAGNGNNQLPSHIGEVLGFRTNANLKGNTTYTAPYVYNLRPSKYIVLRIRNLERVDSNHTPVQDAFCILSVDTRFQNYQLCNNVDQLDNEVYQKDFNPPLGELDRLEIEFLDSNGKPVNFRGRNHFMTFEIVSLSRFSNYSQYGNKK